MVSRDSVMCNNCWLYKDKLVVCTALSTEDGKIDKYRCPECGNSTNLATIKFVLDQSKREFNNLKARIEYLENTTE